ncbi:type IV toxin-antitoxin system AbiEi family antitoxin [Geothrix oryzae]|uniref:type IV toxin-antitoxin system AbiEi family antitoxin n=1 Tax=Geothrix oryzae TaxID=2927975 RepID=UPI0035C998B1
MSSGISPTRWKPPKSSRPPLLIHADLLNIGDPRTHEEAKRIHELYLAWPETSPRSATGPPATGPG